MIVHRATFQTAAQLIKAIDEARGGVLSLDEVYLTDVEGNYLTLLEVEQETLSDGSAVFNFILSEEGDPNS